MKYFFILGNNPTLSVAEIAAVFTKRGFAPTERRLAWKGEGCGWINQDVFVLETDEEIDCEKVIKRIGGTIKIGKIVDEVDEKDDLNEKIIDLLEKQDKPKIKFGISFYGNGRDAINRTSTKKKKEDFNIKKLAMQVKGDLKKGNIEGKWISAKFSNDPLSSVAIEGNKLIKKGVEVVLIENNNKILIGKTLAVQPFKELSYRDYNRPARDDRSGMIPPKLAQIMLNLTINNPPQFPLILRGEGKKIKTHHNEPLQNKNNHKIPLSPPFSKEEGKGGKIIYDPFCGSGTILSEAILMGCKTIIGSDLSHKAVEDTKKNTQWMIDKYKLGKINANIFQLDSQKVSGYLRKPIVDAIVTEPYLGPQRGKIAINRVRKQLERLYSNSLQEFKKILKPGGKIVMIWPIFRINKKSFEINPRVEGYEIINPLPEDLRKNKNIKLTNRNTIVYGRPNQRVWREIVVLEKKE